MMSSRYGDRFWYEGGGWPSSFTQEQVPSSFRCGLSIISIKTLGTDPKYFQLAEIRRVKLSSILCDNSDDIENIQVKVLIFIRTFVGSKVQFGRNSIITRGLTNRLQVYAMVLPDHEINPRVPCKSGVLPRIDLNRWRDASFHAAPSQSFHNGFGKK